MEHPTLNRLMQFLENNLDQSGISTSTICTEIGISRAQLHRLIKDHSGVSLSIFIRQIRLEKAAKLLHSTSYRISEIADMVGIDSPQSFSNYFHKHFGLSPSEYKKSIAKKQKKDISILVFPFKNLPPETDQEFLSDGITGEIIHTLSQIKSIQVIGRSLSLSYKYHQEEPLDIAKSLEATYLLEGSIQRSQDKLRVSVMLTNSAEGFVIWSQKFDTSIQNIFHIQDEISATIFKEIETHLKENVFKASATPKVENVEAFELYLKGKYHFNKFGGPAEFLNSIHYFKEAIKLEPNYAAAYAGIAFSNLSLWFYRFLNAEEGVSEIRFVIDQAVSIDPQNSEALLAKARMKMLLDWDFVASEALFLQSLELEPNNAECNGQYALLLSLLNRKEEALHYLSISRKLDPLSLFNSFFAQYSYWIMGDQENAYAASKHVLEIEPNFWAGHVSLGFNSFKLGDFDTAINELEKAKEINYSGFTLSSIGIIYGLNGQLNKAEGVLQELFLLQKSSPVFHYDFAIVYAGLGQNDLSLKHFNLAIEKHEPSMLFFRGVLRDWLENHVQDARFSQLLELIPRG